MVLELNLLYTEYRVSKQIPDQLQVNDYEIVVNFFHISHNLTWYSEIVHKFWKNREIDWSYSCLQ